MKILMLGWELPPHNSGGLGVACYQLCEALSVKDIDIEFVLPYNEVHSIDFMKVRAALSHSAGSLRISGIAYDSFKYTDTQGNEQWLSIFDQQKLYEQAAAQLTGYESFDIIHAHDWLTFKAGVILKQKTGKPLILHVHSVESDRSGGNYGNPLAREIEQESMLMADKIVAVSQHTKNIIIADYAIPADKIEVIHNSIGKIDEVNLSELNSYKYLAALKNHGYKVISSIGRLTIQKNLINLLHAFKLVTNKEPKAILLFVGNGEQETELLLLAAELGISRNVMFAGFQRGKRWRDAYTIADLFVMPSVSEPFGLTPLEAVALGVPVLISKQSGVSEVLKNALKVDFWDVNEMANQMLAVLQNQSLKNELIVNGSKEYESMNWSKAANQLEEIYAKAVRGVSG
jgi:glycosyltransferase involved in cell wall biosynthesis